MLIRQLLLMLKMSLVNFFNEIKALPLAGMSWYVSHIFTETNCSLEIIVFRVK